MLRQWLVLGLAVATFSALLPLANGVALVHPPHLPDVTVPGALTTPYPTTIAITLVWEIQGDDDQDGAVSVEYRLRNGTAWRTGPSLMRVPAGSYQTFNWSNRHAGSVFDLEPATTYELRLSLSDPDGGSATRFLNVTTRDVPRPMPGAPVKIAGPANFSSIAGGAQPGDIIQLDNGTYAGFTFDRDGAASKPIVIRGSGASVINDNIFADNTRHVMLDTLVINGTVKARGSQNFTMIACRVTPVGGGPEDDGIILWSRSENGYIADNVVLGVTKWEEASLGASGNNSGEGIVVSGPGHVIRNNLVRGFRDGLSLMEDAEAVDQFSIDFLYNDVDQAADDGVEADFCLHNCRVIRNRITNAFMPVSAQPSLGGPLYFVRNVVYDGLYEALKLHRSSVGDVAIHNTFVMHGNAFGVYTSDVNSRQWYRNNLFLGGPGKTLNGYDTGPGLVMDLDPFNATSSFDYDAWGTAAPTFQGRFRGTSFTGLADMRNTTTEKNGIQADYTVFNATVIHPANPFPALQVADLRIKAGSAVEDQGLRIFGVNDGFKGSGPDIGAYEVGDPLPCYGPCPTNDTQPPSIPLNLAATAISSSQVDLRWDPASDNVGVAGYRIHRNGTQLTTTLLTTHSDLGLAASTLYTYAVQAFDAAGNPSSLTAPATATTKPGGGGGGNNSVPVLDRIGQRDVAEAGSLSITLTASDPDGDPLRYSAAGLPSNAAFDGAGRKFTFVPDYTQAGHYDIDFGVSDGRGGSDSELVRISVWNSNRAPTARTAGDATAKVGEVVTLDGSGSSDPDADPLKFSWKQQSGPRAMLSDAKASKPIFTSTTTGTLVFDLTVDDGNATSAPARSRITVEPADDPGGGGGQGAVPLGGLLPVVIVAVVAVVIVAAVLAVLFARRRRKPIAQAFAGEAGFPRM